MLKINSMNCNSTILEARCVYWMWERTDVLTARLYWKSGDGLWKMPSWQDHPNSESTEIKPLSDGLLWVPERYNAGQHQRVCTGTGSPGQHKPNLILYENGFEFCFCMQSVKLKVHQIATYAIGLSNAWSEGKITGTQMKEALFEKPHRISVPDEVKIYRR